MNRFLRHWWKSRNEVVKETFRKLHIVFVSITLCGILSGFLSRIFQGGTGQTILSSIGLLTFGLGLLTELFLLILQGFYNRDNDCPITIITSKWEDTNRIFRIIYAVCITIILVCAVLYVIFKCTQAPSDALISPSDICGLILGIVYLILFVVGVVHINKLNSMHYFFCTSH